MSFKNKEPLYGSTCLSTFLTASEGFFQAGDVILKLGAQLVALRLDGVEGGRRTVHKQPPAVLLLSIIARLLLAPSLEE